MRACLDGLAESAKDQGRGLTPHEFGEVLRRLGLACGCIPVAEYKVDVRKVDLLRQAAKPRRNGEIDWVWLDRANRLVAAFEIEGGNVGSGSIGKDLRSLEAGGADANFILHYRCRYFAKPSDGFVLLPSERGLDRLNAAIAGSRIRLIRDTEAGIDGLIELAAKLKISQADFSSKSA